MYTDDVLISLKDNIALNWKGPNYLNVKKLEFLRHFTPSGKTDGGSFPHDDATKDIASNKIAKKENTKTLF